MNSRQTAIDQLAAQSEKKLMAEIQRSKATVTGALIGTYSGQRNVRAYRGAATSVFQRIG